MDKNQNFGKSNKLKKNNFWTQSRFWAKIVIFDINRNFGQTSYFFIRNRNFRKTKFWTKIQILYKRQIKEIEVLKNKFLFGQKSKFSTNIDIFDKHRKFRKKWKFPRKMEIFDKIGILDRNVIFSLCTSYINPQPQCGQIASLVNNPVGRWGFIGILDLHTPHFIRSVF